MRLIFFLLLLPLPAHAWTFTPGLICKLAHDTATARIELTYDPAKPLYSLTVTQNAPLPDAPFFSMHFVGPKGLTISTDRHVRSGDGLSVTASDTGFGNVLNGLEFNDVAVAILGPRKIAFPLDSAAEPVAQFRKCEVAAGV